MKVNLIARSLVLAGFFTALPLSSIAAEAPKEASAATQQANNALFSQLPFSDNTDFTNAHKGFIVPLPQEVIKGEQGNVIWARSNMHLSKRVIKRPIRSTPASGVSRS